MAEQPVALEIIIRSPNICVNNLIYGVSPQPEHAPENSKSGFSNWLAAIVPGRAGFSFVLRVCAKAQLTDSFSCPS